MPIYLTNINLNGNELQNAILQPLATPPANPKLGQVYTDSTNSKIKWYTGTEWRTIGVIVESSSANGSIKVDGVDMTIYTLPKATASVLGGIKLGTGLAATDEGVVSVDVINNLTSDDTAKPLSAAMGKSLKESINKITTDIGNLGGGDMMKATYDSDDDGIVDDAEKLGGQLPSYYAKATDIPTKLSQLTNDENFIDNTVSNLVNYYTKSETYTQSEVNTLIGNLATIQILIPETGVLPSTGESNIIYLISKATADGAQNTYDEYLWTGTRFERIGDTTIDLSNYLTKTGDASNTTVGFTTASSRTALTTGEALGTLIGKINKYLSDLKTVAFTNSFNDLNDKPTQLVHYTEGTLTAGATTVDVNFTGTFIYAAIRDAVTGEEIFADVTAATNKVTVTLAAAYSNNLIISVLHS